MKLALDDRGERLAHRIAQSVHVASELVVEQPRLDRAVHDVGQAPRVEDLRAAGGAGLRQQLLQLVLPAVEEAAVIVDLLPESAQFVPQVPKMNVVPHVV